MVKQAGGHFGAERTSSFGLPLWIVNHTSDIAGRKFICLSL